MNPTISVIHATYNRPDKAMSTMKVWRDRCLAPHQVEYIFVVNANDETGPKILGDRGTFGRVIVTVADVKFSAPAWNCGALASSGKLFVQAQDDVFPPHGWDRSLLRRIDDNALSIEDSIFIAVGDGYRKDLLCCTAIMTRAYRDMEGHFLYPGYQSMYSDDEVTIRAYGHAADSEAHLIDARDLVFKHEHHYHNATVLMDDTYRHENSPQAYSVGCRIFHERNRRLIDRGFKKW